MGAISFILCSLSLLAQGQPTDVRLSKLYPPNFPSMANAARVGADVELKLSIRQDGMVAAAVVVGGTEHLPPDGAFANWGLPQFKQAALESALHSRFECPGCILPVTLYSLTYSFQPGLLLRGKCPSIDPVNPMWRRTYPPEVSDNHVDVVGPVLPMCPGPEAFHRPFHSAKCLYLWKCSVIPAFPRTDH
jgi:hypothetical protein